MISTLVAGRSIAAEDSDLARLLPVWDHAVTVRTDVGYNDNVLLGAEPLQSSAFLSAALEALLWRLPIDGPEAQFLVSAEARCYAPSDFADYEQNLLTEAQVKRSFARDWQIALTADYLFQSLYVDETTVDAVSLQTTVGAAKVQGPGFVLAPALRRYLGESGWIETGGRAARFLYGSSVGDYWELGPSFRLGGAFTRRSEGSIGYQVLTRDYDNRPAVFLDGSPLPGSRLRITEHDFNLAFRSHWGPDRRWNTQLLVSRRSNEDNGAGYFDYVRWAAGGELTHRHAGWETSLGVGLNHYNYRQNRFGTFSDRWDWSLTWSVEKRLHPRWKLRADYRREQALTDTHTDEYSVNEIAAGVVWEF